MYYNSTVPTLTVSTTLSRGVPLAIQGPYPVVLEGEAAWTADAVLSHVLTALPGVAGLGSVTLGTWMLG